MIGKLLGIDHGLKRIGVATSDALGITARELLIIERKSKIEDFAKLNAIAHEQNVVAVIVGLPMSEARDGEHTQQDIVQRWVERFQETTHLPIILWDEQFSSQDAKALAKMQKRHFREPIDDLAARLILQSYLDSLRDGFTTFPEG